MFDTCGLKITNFNYVCGYKYSIDSLSVSHLFELAMHVFQGGLQLLKQLAQSQHSRVLITHSFVSALASAAYFGDLPLTVQIVMQLSGLF